MFFQFGPRSALLLPFVVPGGVAALWLLGLAWRRGAAPDALLALLIGLPTLGVSQWMLGYAGWFDSHDGYSTFMFYVPWQLGLLTGPAYYLYFRSLTNQEFRLGRRAGRHLLPGLAQLALFGGVALLDLGWRRGLRHEALPDFFGTKGAAATWRDGLFEPLNWLGVALLLGYGLQTLRDYRRYRRYLDDNFSDPERLRFAGLRQLLVLQALVLTVGLLFTVLDGVFDLSYDTSWYFFALRGAFIYGLIVLGIQANYAAASSPLRFGAEGYGPLPGAPEGVGLAPAPQPAQAAAATSGVATGTSALAIAGLEVATASSEVAISTSEKAISTSELLSSTSEVLISSSELANSTPEVPISTAEVLSSSSELPISTSEVLLSTAEVLLSTAEARPLPPELAPWRAKLLRLMADEQPWLEPELTLTELAQRLRTHPALLSKVINAGCGQNFNDFVNTYRVAEARRKLADPRYGHYSLVGVALESGFNSKSTFNRVFKKLAGQAPGEVARPKS